MQSDNWSEIEFGDSLLKQNFQSTGNRPCNLKPDTWMLYFGWQDDVQWNIVNLPLLKRMHYPLGPTDASPSRRLRHRDGQQAACLTASLMVNANVNQHNSQQPIHVLNHASQRSSYKIKLQLIEVTKNIFKKIESCHMKPLVLC